MKVEFYTHTGAPHRHTDPLNPPNLCFTPTPPIPPPPTNTPKPPDGPPMHPSPQDLQAARDLACCPWCGDPTVHAPQGPRVRCRTCHRRWEETPYGGIIEVARTKPDPDTHYPPRLPDHTTCPRTTLYPAKPTKPH